jgi:hypothetical protein
MVAAAERELQAELNVLDGEPTSWLGQRWRTGVNGGSGLPLEVVAVTVYSGIRL